MNTQYRNLLRATFRALGPVVEIGALALILRFLWSQAFIEEFTSDTSDTLLWAQASADSGWLVNRSFAYGYVMPLGGHLLVWPFLGAFGGGIDALRAGMTVFSVILACAVFAFFRTSGFGTGGSGFASAFVLLAFSATVKLREIMYGHVLYYSIAALALALAFAALPDRGGKTGGRAQGPWRGAARFAALAAVLAWTASNGAPCLLFVVIPFVFALAAERLLSPEPLAARSLGLPVLAAAAGLAGLAAHSILVKGVPVAYGSFYDTLSPSRAWGPHIVGLVQNWCTLFCDMPANPQFPASSPEGMRHALRLALSVALPVASLGALAFWRSLSGRTRLVALAHLAVFAATAFFQVFGNIADGNWRHVPTLASELFLAPLLVRDAWRSGRVPRRGAAIAAAAIAASAVLFASRLLHLPGLAAATPPEARAWTGPSSVLTVLREQGADAAFCQNFWVANAVTALSTLGGRPLLPVREVSFSENRGWHRRAFNNASYHFSPDSTRRRTALVCHASLEPFAPAERRIATVKSRQADYRNRRWIDFAVIVYDGDFPIPCPAAAGQDATLENDGR